VLFAFLLHGFFILAARYRLSYDAYTHMLFADHYARDWFSLWETRWYTGFEVVSYPPLTHQLIALLIPIFGFEKAYAAILWIVTSLYPLGVYAFGRNFAGKTASSYAALASAFLLPICVTAHIFGQLPFLTATLFALFGSAAVSHFLREGGLSNLLLAVSITATTMAAHHATLMVQPFFILAITLFQIKQQNWKALFFRLALYLLLAIPAGILVIWPFWQWGMHQQLQTPIDHLSRHNFLSDPFAIAIFFFPFYFPIGAIIPFLWKGWPRKFIGLQFSFVILFILGLGGTTPLPGLLFGKSWEWLTYDRFAFWAVLLLTPFFGILLIHFKRWMRPRFKPGLIPASFRGTFIQASIFFILACTAVGSWYTPKFLKIQPDPIDMQPIVNFLHAKDHYYWRYLTFGFGDQFAHLSLLTDKTTTIDGSYHTARTLPELRGSGIGQIDTSYWASKGIPAIGPILQASGGYGVRWGFVNLEKFVPELEKNGWVFVEYLSNGIQVWENPNFIFKPPVIPPADPFESFSWGIFPMLSLITTFGLAISTLPGETVLRRAYAAVMGLLPISLSLWYYKTIFEFNHTQVYFTYDHALFFLSDGLSLVAVIFWLAARTTRKTMPRLSPVLKLVFALCSWITLSAFWSVDWRTSLYIAAHFWLIFLLILSLQDWHQAWSSILKGLCAALVLQAVIGIIEFNLQSNEFLAVFNLHWPGLIDAASPDASILKFPDGQNFLRAYGTFPHPNMLGGFVVICMAAVIALILKQKKISWPILLLLIPGPFLLVVTFSRAAWIGAAVFCLILMIKLWHSERKKIVLIFSITAVVALLALIPLRQLFISRTTAPTTPTEEFSLVGRIWLSQQALAYAEERPLTGVGIGSFIIQLAEREGERNFVEPVHNVPLLVISELGIVGLVLLLVVFLSIAREFLATKRINLILIGALLAGMSTITLFDHYFWSLAPGRMMLGLTFGLWLGQAVKDDE
jgi:O-antigen ligase